MNKGFRYRRRMIKANCLLEVRGVLNTAVDVDTVRIVVIDIEKLQLIDELPVPAEAEVRLLTQHFRLGLGEVRFPVDQGHHPPSRLICPGALHESTVEVWALICEEWVSRDAP